MVFLYFLQSAGWDKLNQPQVRRASIVYLIVKSFFTIENNQTLYALRFKDC